MTKRELTGIIQGDIIDAKNIYFGVLDNHFEIESFIKDDGTVCIRYPKQWPSYYFTLKGQVHEPLLCHSI